MGVVGCAVLFAVLTKTMGFQLDLVNIPTIEEFLQMPGPYDGKIVGGEEADIEDHPYQVSFIVNNQYFCGGFIVSENYIVTAAHCAQNVDPSTVVLRAGSSYRKNGTIIPIAEVIPHPEYDDPAFDKDVGVMRTVDPIPINNETIMPIPLPPEGRDMNGGTDIFVSGWGRTQQGASSIPERLMAVTIPVVYYTQCFLVYPSTLTRNQFCAGNFFLGGKSTCQGDSGGAAIQDGMAVGIVSYGRGCGQRLSPSGDSGGAAIQDGMAVGIVSYGRICGQPLSPSVFADIASPTIRQFIKEHTGL